MTDVKDKEHKEVEEEKEVGEMLIVPPVGALVEDDALAAPDELFDAFHGDAAEELEDEDGVAIKPHHDDDDEGGDYPFSGDEE